MARPILAAPYRTGAPEDYGFCVRTCVITCVVTSDMCVDMASDTYTFV